MRLCALLSLTYLASLAWPEAPEKAPPDRFKVIISTTQAPVSLEPQMSEPDQK